MGIEIVGIAGSLRRESLNRRLLEAAARMLPLDAELRIWDGLERIVPFSEDLEAGPAPGGVEELRRVLAGADAVLIATPEYNGSIPAS